MGHEPELYNEKSVTTRHEDVESPSPAGSRDLTSEGPEPGVTFKTWIVIGCMMVGFVSYSEG